MKKYQHFINGQWTDPDSGEWFDSETPIQARYGHKLPEAMQQMSIKR